MIVQMDKASTSSSRELAQRLYDKNIELENRRRKSAQARVPSDPNAWQQMRENFETIILEDHSFSEKHSIEFALWQLHYRRIEEFRAHYSAASTTDSATSQNRGGAARPDRASKIRLQFKTFLSEATGFYHDLILKIRAKYGLPIGQFYPEPENHNVKEKDGKIRKGLISCHRCLIYLGDLARYKGLYGEGDSKSRDYAAASSYYLQAASLWPSSGNPHHQLAILATYSGDELMAVYRYFRSLAADNPFSTARDNLIVAFEKNRQSYSQLHIDPKALSIKESPVPMRGKGSGKGEPVVRSKEPITDTSSDVGRPTEIRQMFKAFRVCFVRLNGILFTRTSLETFEEILSLVSNALQELLSSGPEEELSFGTDAVENGLFIVILVSILIFTVNNVKGGAEGQSYADIVQHTVLLQDALITFYELTGQLLKRCVQLADPSSSFLLPGILVCVEWLASRPDVAAHSETDEKQTAAQIKFWTYCVSLFNKLIPSDDVDMSSFNNMKSYKEGESEYQLALWEDFELRGFMPLQPAHSFLDFSRKHSLGGDSKKDKVARVKRILAVGKVIADMITVDRKKVRFDAKLKQFVIGVDAQKHTDSPESNGGVKEISIDATATVVITRPKVESLADGEEEDDEVIVFKPTVIENRTEVIASKGFGHVQNINMSTSQFTDSQSLLPVNNLNPNIGQTNQFQSPMWPGNRQVALTGGLQGLNLLENGHVVKPGMQMHRDNEVLNGASLSLPIQAIGTTSETMVQTMSDGTSASSFEEAITHRKYDMVTDPYSMARNAFSTMPTNSSKISTNRPVRHLGPPPGFSSVRPKQVNEQSSVLGQNPLTDDYSWLDGYQLQASTNSGIQPPNLRSQYVNDSVAKSSFPFPGKQASVVQFEEGPISWQERANMLASLNSHHGFEEGPISWQERANMSASLNSHHGFEEGPRSWQERENMLASSNSHHGFEEGPISWRERANMASLNSHHESLQQQYIPQLDQQGQAIWKGNHFV